MQHLCWWQCSRERCPAPGLPCLPCPPLAAQTRPPGTCWPTAAERPRAVRSCSAAASTACKIIGTLSQPLRRTHSRCHPCQEDAGYAPCCLRPAACALPSICSSTGGCLAQYTAAVCAPARSHCSPAQHVPDAVCADDSGDAQPVGLQQQPQAAKVGLKTGCCHCSAGTQSEQVSGLV